MRLDIDYENLTVGEILNITRRKQGYSISEIVRTTKIRYSHIQYIENNQYNELPERTYTLGYIARYSKFLGLDPEIMVKKAENEYVLVNPKYSNMVQNNRLDKKYNPINVIKENIIDFIFILFTFGFKRYSVDKENFSKKNERKYKKIWLFLAIFFLIIVFFIGLYIFKKVTKIIIDEKPIIIDNTLANELDLQKLQKDLTKDGKNNKVITQDDLVILDKKFPENNDNTIELTKNIDNEEIAQSEKKTILTPWPLKNELSNITLFFNNTVWVKLYDKYNKSIVYLDKNFKKGDYFNIPKVANLIMDVGDYRGLYLMVKNKIIYLTSEFPSSVIRRINLSESELINKYGN